MADNIIENHDVNTMEHELKTHGCLLKEIIKKIQLGNHVKETFFVHVRSIEDDQHVVRSIKTHGIIIGPGYIPRNQTVETEMTSGKVIKFEKDWKKLWHPTMTRQARRWVSELRRDITIWLA